MAESEIIKMNNIDHRRHYIVMMDTETANTLTRADGGLDMLCSNRYWRRINCADCIQGAQT